MPSRKFQKYQKMLLNSPELAVVTEHPELPIKCEDGAKVFKIVYYI